MPPTPLAIFLAFTRVSVVSVGGGTMAWIREITVRRRGWLSEDEFAQALAVCQFLPGANTLNMATFLGSQLGGRIGAAAALLGLTTLPFAVVMGLGWLYFATGNLPQLRGVFRGLGAAAAGVAFGTGLQMGSRLRRDRRFLGLTLVIYLSLGFLRVNMVLAVLLVGLLAVLAYPEARTSPVGSREEALPSPVEAREEAWISPLEARDGFPTEPPQSAPPPGEGA